MPFRSYVRFLSTIQQHSMAEGGSPHWTAIQNISDRDSWSNSWAQEDKLDGGWKHLMVLPRIYHCARKDSCHAWGQHQTKVISFSKCFLEIIEVVEVTWIPSVILLFSIFLFHHSSKVLVQHTFLTPPFYPHNSVWQLGLERPNVPRSPNTFNGSENLNPDLPDPNPLKPLHHTNYRAVLQSRLEAEWVSSLPPCLRKQFMRNCE